MYTHFGYDINNEPVDELYELKIKSDINIFDCENTLFADSSDYNTTIEIRSISNNKKCMFNDIEKDLQKIIDILDTELNQLKQIRTDLKTLSTEEFEQKYFCMGKQLML